MRAKITSILASVEAWLNWLIEAPARSERMERKMDEIIQELKETKQILVSYQEGVVAKISTLEATLAANGGGNAELKATVDDLKQFAQGLTVPE